MQSFSFDAVDELADIHARLTAPTLMWGADDPSFPVEHARAMTAQFAGPTRFAVIEDAKLLVHEESAERFARLTKSSLTEFAGVA